MKNLVFILLTIVMAPSRGLPVSPSVDKVARKEAKALCDCSERYRRTWIKANEKSIKRGETYIGDEGQTILGTPWVTNTAYYNNCLQRKRLIKNMRDYIDSLSDQELNMFNRILKRELKAYCEPSLNLTVVDYTKNAFAN